jgi:broad specificity phosphatase PhoE
MPIVATILLARHGETDWNRDKLWQGHADMPLNDQGRRQARALADRLEPVSIAAIYSSDLRRAHETASIVAERKSLPVKTMRELREVDTGSWTGLSRDDARERFPEAYAEFKARTGKGWEDGETYAELGVRIVQALSTIAEAHGEERILVVTHAGPIRFVNAHALGLDYASDRKAVPQVARTSLSAVVVAGGTFRPLDQGIDDYLKSAGSPVA